MALTPSDVEPLFHKLKTQDETAADKRGYWRLVLLGVPGIILAGVLLANSKHGVIVSAALGSTVAGIWYAAFAIRRCVPYKVTMFEDRICIEDPTINECIPIDDLSQIYIVAQNRQRSDKFDIDYGALTVDGRKISLHAKLSEGFLEALSRTKQRAFAVSVRYSNRVLRLTYDAGKVVELPGEELLFYGEGERILAQTSAFTVYVRTKAGVTYWLGLSSDVMPTMRQLRSDFPALEFIDKTVREASNSGDPQR